MSKEYIARFFETLDELFYQVPSHFASARCWRIWSIENADRLCACTQFLKPAQPANSRRAR